MENREFFEKLSGWTPFCIEVEIDKLQIFMGIMNNLGNEKIQRVIDWPGPRTVDGYDDGGYCELCAGITRTFCRLDSYSGLMHAMYSFTSDAILFIADQNKEAQKKLKVEKIKKLTEEVKKLEEELK
jgi:hypothetical protein